MAVESGVDAALILAPAIGEDSYRAIVAHYERVAGLLASPLSGLPLVSTSYPGGWAKDAAWHAGVHKPLPHSIPTVKVASPHGERTYVALTESSLLWLAHRYSVEFFSWTPSAHNPNAVGFARILLAPAGRAGEGLLKMAALTLRSMLERAGLDAILLFDGFTGAALWIPFADAPAYEAVREWLAHFVDTAVRAHPDLLTIAPKAERGDRIHLSIQSNAPGRFSALPYSVRGTDALPVVLPIRWSELAEIAPGEYTVATLPARLNTAGDVFAEEAARIGRQDFAGLGLPATPAPLLAFGPFELQPRGRVITAAVAILEDGKPRSADELLAEAIARAVLPRSTTAKYIYSSLIEYIARSKGHDRKPLIVQDPDRRFRINHPADDWPAPQSPLPRRTPACGAITAIERLRATATAGDPAAFERAVCDAFACLGFVATHVGGAAAPDGFIDAPLGPLGYRVMLECKTGRTVVAQPDAFEAAKYRDAYNAQFAALIGPAFGEDVALAGELKIHGVSAWTVEDLATLITHAADPHELRSLFAPGFAADALADLLWERDHGAAKRVTVICEELIAAGWAEQLAVRDSAADAPLLTEDAAMMLVDQRLAEAGALQPCTRTDLQAAFDYLTSPRIAAAAWTSPARSAIVVLRLAPLSARATPSSPGGR